MIDHCFKMGNVLASGPPVPPPLPPALVVDEHPLENPGTVEDLHKKTKGCIIVSVFDI